MFKDPTTAVVFGIAIVFVVFVIAAKISTDKADREAKIQKEEKEREGKKKS